MARINSTTKEKITGSAEIVWRYMKMNHTLQPVDLIFVIGSRDDRVANYAAELYRQGFGKTILVSGGVSHKNDLLKAKWQTETESQHFAGILIKHSVPASSIIMEQKATNTGENITFGYEMLVSRKIYPKSIVLVQKPYMERRTYATFMKQWPGKTEKVSVSSPPYSLAAYITKDQPFELVVSIMVGDLQRVMQYPALGYQIEQKYRKMS